MGHAILKVPEGRLTQTNHQRYPAIQIPHDKNQLPHNAIYLNVI
jgi:hypothetical protein